MSNRTAVTPETLQRQGSNLVYMKTLALSGLAFCPIQLLSKQLIDGLNPSRGVGQRKRVEELSSTTAPQLFCNERA